MIKLNGVINIFKKVYRNVWKCFFFYISGRKQVKREQTSRKRLHSFIYNWNFLPCKSTLSKSRAKKENLSIQSFSLKHVFIYQRKRKKYAETNTIEEDGKMIFQQDIWRHRKGPDKLYKTAKLKVWTSGEYLMIKRIKYFVWCWIEF